MRVMNQVYDRDTRQQCIKPGSEENEYPWAHEKSFAKWFDNVHCLFIIREAGMGVTRFIILKIIFWFNVNWAQPICASRYLLQNRDKHMNLQ